MLTEGLAPTERTCPPTQIAFSAQHSKVLKHGFALMCERDDVVNVEHYPNFVCGASATKYAPVVIAVKYFKAKAVRDVASANRLRTRRLLRCSRRGCYLREWSTHLELDEAKARLDPTSEEAPVRNVADGRL